MMDKKKVVIADIVRTPWGKPCGSMEKFISSDYSAVILKKLLERNGVEPLAIDQVVFGQSMPTTMPNNIGHYAWLKAELPVDVPGYTVQSVSGSALQALRNSYYLIATGNEGVCIAGGADSYSAGPFVMRDVRNHFYPKDRGVIDTLDEAECCTQPEPMSRMEQYEKAHGAEMTDAQKAFAAESRAKAEKFAEVCGDAVVSLSYTDRKKGEIIISKDEWLGTEAEAPLAPYADGGAVALLASEEKAAELGLTAKAEILGFAVAGCDPVKQQTSGAAAAAKLLKNKGLTVDDIACFEIIENSAAHVLETVEALGFKGKVNPFGGALAFGKCDGAEGIAMLMRLTASLEAGQLGVACTYSAGGQGMAVLVKKI